MHEEASHLAIKGKCDPGRRSSRCKGAGAARPRAPGGAKGLGRGLVFPASLILIPIKVQILAWLPAADLLWGETLFFNDSKYPLPLSKASWFGQHNHVKDTSRHAQCGFSLRRWNKSLLPW